MDLELTLLHYIISFRGNKGLWQSTLEQDIPCHLLVKVSNAQRSALARTKMFTCYLGDDKMALAIILHVHLCNLYISIVVYAMNTFQIFFSDGCGYIFNENNFFFWF